MASIRIRNKSDSGGIPGLTKGELAVNLADAVLWVGGTTDNPIFLSGVQSFNGLTGHVNGVCAAQENTFTALQTFNSGISAAGGITFNSLSHFTAGLSGSGATLGTLVVNSGISASGGVTFHNDVWVGGLLTANGGISAAGGVTFANNLSVGGTLSVNNDISYSGGLFRNGQAVKIISTFGTTSDLPRPGVQGDVAIVSEPDSDYGLYLWDGGISFEFAGVTGAWVRITNQNRYVWNPDADGSGVVDGNDLSFLLAAWGAYGTYYSGGGEPITLQMGIGDNIANAFEIKVYGATAGKKTSAFKITSNDAVPQIYMKAGTVEMDSDLTIYPVGDYTTTIKQTGYLETGFIHVKGSTSGGKGSTCDGNLAIGGLLTLNSGLSAGCGVTFNCLTHFTQGLSASGATLGTLTVNGGATFNGPVYMGATLTMNSNIRFNSGFGITGGFIDAGWY